MTTQVLLLPGGVTPAELAYGALLEALGDDVHAVAKDLELYAGSTPPERYTLRHELDGIQRTADTAGFDRFHLVGYSGGGAASLAFAAEHPERVATLALIEPAWMGNDGLSPEERVVWHELERIAALAPDQMMPAFVAVQLAPAVAPPPPPPGPPPHWMTTRPAGLRALIAAFAASDLDRGRLRRFDGPVLFVLADGSNPDLYGRMAERASTIFADFTLERFAGRHHFDPPHRAEPVRTAALLRAHWQRGTPGPARLAS